MLLFMIAAFLIIAGIVSWSFLNIKRYATEETGMQLRQVSESSMTARELSDIFSEIDLVRRTFYERNDILNTRGSSISRGIKGIGQRTSDSRIRKTLNALEQELMLFIAQCAEVNRLLAGRQHLGDEALKELSSLEELVSRRMIEYTKKGLETYYFDQIFSLVTGYRESLLLISNINLQQEYINFRQLIINIDDLLLRMQTMTATTPEVAVHGKRLILGITQYRSTIVKLESSLRELDSHSRALRAIQSEALAILHENDQKTLNAASIMSSNISRVVQSSHSYVIGISLVVIAVVSLLTLSLIRSSISRPFQKILGEISAIKEGRFIGDGQALRQDEWGIIQGALLDMHRELTASMTALRQSQAFLDGVIENLPAMIFTVFRI